MSALEQAEKLAELEEDLARAERVLAETENRAAKQWAVMVEQQWEAFGEDFVVAQLRGGEAEERAEQVWRYL